MTEVPTQRSAGTPSPEGDNQANGAPSARLSRKASGGGPRPPYQVEGATNEDGGRVDLGRFAPRRARSPTANRHVAVDHYRLYKEDVALMKALGATPIASRSPGRASFPTARARESEGPRLLQPAGRRAARQRHRALRDALSLGPAAETAGTRAAGSCATPPTRSPTMPAMSPRSSATG